MIQSFPHRWRPGSDWAEFDRVLCPLVDEDTEHEQVQVSRHHHHRYQHQNYHQNHYVVGSVNLCSISSDLQAKGTQCIQHNCLLLLRSSVVYPVRCT